MCGIAGIFHLKSNRAVTVDALRPMADAIAHRGPDAEGFWTGPGVGLAHRRLSIIDLADGAQPMANEDHTVQVVFNGEIYNFRSLREQLVARGHQFRTHSDTEVLVHLYEDHGEQLVDQLRGMFAFALWDDRHRKLLLARDRIGLKPLYYCLHDGRLLFGSEIKALLAAGNVPRELDDQALDEYLTYGFVPGDRSIFRAIRKLPPAHWVSVAAGDDPEQLRPQRYWQLSTALDESLDAEAWMEAIGDKFRETVAAHRVSDVPIGAFLSGGVDSGAIVAELARQGGTSLSTFSIGFQERRFSELPEARMVAQRYGTSHIEEIVTPEAAASLDELVHHYDEPFADASAVPTMAVARLASRHVKVVLSGDGGDEAFGGYGRYRHDLKEAAIRAWIPRLLQRTLLHHAAALWPQADWLPQPLRWKSALTNLSLDPARAYANSMAITRSKLRQGIFGRHHGSGFHGRSPEQWVADRYPGGSLGPLESMTYTDIGTILPDDFLTKVDRASMAVGLEVRPPLVDHEFLQLSARMPGRWKLRDGQSKWIFKQLMQKTLPPEILRRRKMGFEIPIDAWLRQELREPFQESVLLPSHPIAGVIDQVFVRQLYHSHLRGRGRYGITLWSLLVLAKWMDRYSRQPTVATNHDHFDI